MEVSVSDKCWTSCCSVYLLQMPGCNIKSGGHLRQLLSKLKSHPVNLGRTNEATTKNGKSKAGGWNRITVKGGMLGDVSQELRLWLKHCTNINTGHVKTSAEMRQ